MQIFPFILIWIAINVRQQKMSSKKKKWNDEDWKDRKLQNIQHLPGAWMNFFTNVIFISIQRLCDVFFEFLRCHEFFYSFDFYWKSFFRLQNFASYRALNQHLHAIKMQIFVKIPRRKISNCQKIFSINSNHY